MRLAEGQSHIYHADGHINSAGTANVLPMNHLNQARTNVIDRRQFNVDLQVFSESETCS
jgi:hypothetical protein